MLRTPGFYAIWLSFMFLAMAGLMLVGVNKLFGRDALVESGWYDDPLAAGAAASTSYAISFALANGLGRIGWGAISDRTGWRLAIVLMAVTQGLLMFGFFQFGGNLIALYIFLALTGFNFGGNFALFPLATANRFGTQAVGANYPLIFTAYGIGGIVGPIMAGGFKDAATDSGTDAWLLPFMIAGSLCLVAAVLIALTHSRRSTG
jgi:OFA family oxalate/formate antiporter-like MFS transporter